MRLLFLGAGGIGGYYASRLFQAGHEVVVTARGEHLSTIREAGLVVEYEGESFNCALPAFDHASLKETYESDFFDLIILSLKSTATEPVMRELKGWLSRADVPVLSLQNGVENEAQIAEVVGEHRVIGGLAVRIGGHVQAPGKIIVEGAAQIVVGIWPRDTGRDDPRSQVLARIESSFNLASIPTTVTSDIRRELWRKLIINNGVNPLSALTGLDTQQLTHHPQLIKVVYGMMEETVAASRADNVNLTHDDLEEMFELISGFNAIKTSMLVDKEKGRPLELDGISGAVLRRCDSLGVSAPFTLTVDALLRQNN